MAQRVSKQNNIMDLTLDEIIKQNRSAGWPKTKKFQQKKNAPKQPKKPAFKPAKQNAVQFRDFDARNKIVLKTRAKISDAREILNKNKLQSEVVVRPTLPERKFVRLPSATVQPKGRFDNRVNTMPKRRRSVTPTRPRSVTPTRRRPVGHYQVKQSANKSRSPGRMPSGSYQDRDNMQQQEDEEINRAWDMVGANKPTSNINSLSVNKDSLKSSRNRIERPARVLRPTENMLHMAEQRNLVASTNMPDTLRVRLFGKQPERRVSHGIYANENVNQDSSMVYERDCPTPGPRHCVLVTNLHVNVTTADVRELFSDIGPIYNAYMVRPGTAEVFYDKLVYAELSVDAYHQREFDGMPMQCVLINPHSSNRPSSYSRVVPSYR